MDDKPTYEELELRVQELEKFEAERKRLEKELRESENRYRCLVEGSPDIIYSFSDKRGGFYVTPRVESVLGYSPTYLSENPFFWHDSIHPEDLEKVDTAIQEFSEGKSFDIEYRIKGADGNWRWFRDRSIGRNKTEEEIIIEGLATDITDQKRAEKALQENEKKLRNIIEHSNEVFYIHGTDHVLTFVSSTSKDIFGYTPEEMMRNWTELIIDNPLNQRGFEHTQKAIETGERQEPYLLEAKKKDGTLFFLEIEESPIKDAEGKVLGIVGAARDVTERKRTEEALRESENRFRNLVESSPVGMCIIQQNQIMYQNHSLKRLLGPLPKRYENHILDYLHPDDVEKCKEVYRQIISRKTQKLDFDFRFYPPGKKDRKFNLCWVQCYANLVDYQGEDAILLNMMDITGIKELEHLLIIKQKMSSLGHVAAGIAHEIRNPLTGINSYLFTLEDLCDSEIIEGDQIETIKQIISQIQLASVKIEAVIKKVLDFSRPNPPKMDLIDIDQCIEATLNLSASTLRKNDIKLEKSLAPDLPKCYGDSHLIEQVLLNLINNAIWVIEKNQKTKRIRIDSFRKNKSIYILVADSGPGIPKELKNQIFDPFFTTSSSGTGIGLSIAQRIISDHNGTIEILKSKWGGSTFRVKLPIEKRAFSR